MDKRTLSQSTICFQDATTKVAKPEGGASAAAKYREKVAKAKERAKAQALAKAASPPVNSAPASETPPAGALNADQRHAVKLASEGTSFFLTGGAGTGKSYTTGHVITALQKRHGEDSVFVTGSTGIAACHIGGTTLHSFAGIGLGNLDTSALIGRVLNNRVSKRRWGECCALVIDEVSMCGARRRSRDP